MKVFKKIKDYLKSLSPDVEIHPDLDKTLLEDLLIDIKDDGVVFEVGDIQEHSFLGHKAICVSIKVPIPQEDVTRIVFAHNSNLPVNHNSERMAREACEKSVTPIMNVLKNYGFNLSSFARAGYFDINGIYYLYVF